MALICAKFPEFDNHKCKRLQICLPNAPVQKIPHILDKIVKFKILYSTKCFSTRPIVASYAVGNLQVPRPPPPSFRHFTEMQFVNFVTIKHFFLARLQIRTPGAYDYKVAVINLRQSLVFRVLAEKDAHILLMEDQNDETSNVYEIVIGMLVSKINTQLNLCFFTKLQPKRNAIKNKVEF